MKIYFVALVAALLQLAGASEPSAKADEEYFLRYSVRDVSNGLARGPLDGKLELMEAGGNLRCNYIGKLRPSFSYLYDGKDSLTVLLGTGQAWFRSGFAFEPPLRVLLPFNLNCHRMFQTVDTDGQQKDTSRSGGFNAKVYQATVEGRELYIPSTTESSNGEIRRITIGSVAAPVRQYIYSGYTSVGRMPIPKSIVLVEFRQKVDDQGHVKSAESSRIALALVDADKKAPKSARASMQSLLTRGMLITCQTSEGSAGVLYDPASGSFEMQRKREVQSAKGRKPTFIGGRKAAEHSDPPVIPLALCGIFGSGAIAFLWRQRRQKNTIQ